VNSCSVAGAARALAEIGHHCLTCRAGLPGSSWAVGILALTDEAVLEVHARDSTADSSVKVAQGTLE
jgi:hypothetical protein